GPNSAELGGRFLTEVLHAGSLPSLIVVQDLVIHALIVRSTNAERNDARDVLCDRRNAASNLREPRIEAHGQVSAANVEANSGNRNLPLIGNNTTDRLGVSKVAVS